MQVASNSTTANYAQLFVLGLSSTKATASSDTSSFGSSAADALTDTPAAQPAAMSVPVSLLASSTASALFQQTQGDSSEPIASQTAETTSATAKNSSSSDLAPDGTPYAKPLSMTGAMGLPNLTDADVSMVEAAMGVKQVIVPNPSGFSNTLVQLQNAAGQNLDNTPTFATFNNALLGLSAAKTGGAISEAITANNFDSVMSQAGINFTASESAAAKEWLLTNSASA